MVGNQTALLTVSPCMVMNANQKAMMSLAVKRSENSILIQVISIAEENCGPEKQHSFSKVVEWIHGWVKFRIQDSSWGSLPYATS